MTAAAWTYADLEPDQLALVQEAERTLGTAVVMAYQPSAYGTIDPDALPDGLEPASLGPTELERLQGVERRVDGVLVAYRLRVD